MPPRNAGSVLPWLLCCAALLLAPAVARADISSPGERIVPSDVVFTGLRDFPAYRFVVAVIPFSGDSWRPGHGKPPPTPTAVREGEPLSTDTIYFEELRAIPSDTPEPVTDAWLASSKAPTSGSFTRHPLRVPIASGERMARAHYQVRQIRAGWVSVELLSAVALGADGSQRPLSKPIPQSYAIESIKAPSGWQIFLMPDPTWPRAEPSPPPIPCAVGDVLPLTPGPRTLVAVQGAPGPDGSLEGKTFFSWGGRLDAWRREEVSVGSAAVVHQERVILELEPGNPRPLEIGLGELYEDAEGRRFEDEEARLYPIKTPHRWGRWAAGGATVAALLAAGAWARRRRIRSR